MCLTQKQLEKVAINAALKGHLPCHLFSILYYSQLNYFYLLFTSPFPNFCHFLVTHFQSWVDQTVPRHKCLKRWYCRQWWQRCCHSIFTDCRWSA